MPLVLGDDDYENVIEGAADKSSESGRDMEGTEESDIEQLEIAFIDEKRDAIPMDTDSADIQDMGGEGDKDSEQVHIKFAYTDEEGSDMQKTGAVSE